MISTARIRSDGRRGLVLIELLIVISLVGMLTAAGMLSFGAMWGNLRFKRQARHLVSFFQMAQDGAAQSDRRYAVVIDFPEQMYLLRQYVTTDLATLPDDEAIIDTGYFSESFQLDYVVYDDLDDTRDKEVVEQVRFLAGRAGWQYGGKVVLRDGDGNPWSILITRMGQPVKLVEGDAPFLLPRNQNEMLF